MKHYIIYIIMCAMLLASCGIYGKYKPVASSEVDSRLYGAVESSDTASLALTSWRMLFADTCLQRLIDSCLAHNVDMRAARLRTETAQASLTAARLSYLPSLTLTPYGGVTRYKDWPAGKVYELPVTASWQVDLFGQLLNGHRSSRALRDQMQEVQQAVQAGLVAGVANLYYTLAMLDEQLQIARTTEQAWQGSVKSIRALMEAGYANQAAVSQLEAAWLGVQTSVVELEQSRNEVSNALSLLLMEPAGTFTDLHPDLVTLDVDLQVGVPCQLLSLRPDVRAAEAALRQSFYANQSATAAFFPVLNLSGKLGWTNTTGSEIIDPGFSVRQAVVSLVQPLFANGRLRAQKRAARNELEIASLTFSNTLLSAGNEVNNYLDAAQKARQKRQLYQLQVEALQRAYDATQLTMEYGNTTYLEVLTAQQSLLSAQLGQVANRFSETQAIINLYTALGGGVR